MEVTLSTAKIIYEPDERLVIVRPFEGVTIDKKEYCEQFEAALSLTKGNRAGVLICTSLFLTVTDEAKKESANPDKQKQMIAQAIVTPDLASRLIGNFYIKMMKPQSPTRLFKTEEKARKWLKVQIAREKVGSLSN